MLPEVIQQSLKMPIQLAARGVDGGFEVGAGMTCLEDFQEVLKIMDQAVPEMGHEIGVAPDRPLKTLQPLAGDTAALQRLEEAIEIAVAAEEFQVRLTNHDVIGS